MAEVMLALGEFKFSVSTAEYQSLKTTHSWRWAQKDRFVRKPAKQFHGSNASTKSLDISIYPQNANDLSHFQRIKNMADTGKPVRLVAGGARWVDGNLISAGADLGLWVIESLSVDESMFLSDGTALEQKGSLAISEYGEDGIN